MSCLPKGARKHPGGLRGVCNSFSQNARRMAGCLDPEDRFPDHVAYESTCGPFCSNATPASTLRAHATFVHGLTQCTKCVASKAAQVASACALFVFEVMLEGSRSFGFVYLAAAQGRSGRHAPKQNWVLCEVEHHGDPGQADFEGTRVRLARSDFVEHSEALLHPLRCQRFPGEMLARNT
jgi:hypothetical protein